MTESDTTSLITIYFSARITFSVTSICTSVNRIACLASPVVVSPTIITEFKASFSSSTKERSINIIYFECNWKPKFLVALSSRVSKYERGISTRKSSFLQLNSLPRASSIQSARAPEHFEMRVRLVFLLVAFMKCHTNQWFRFDDFSYFTLTSCISSCVMRSVICANVFQIRHFCSHNEFVFVWPRDRAKLVRMQRTLT